MSGRYDPKAAYEATIRRLIREAGAAHEADGDLDAYIERVKAAKVAADEAAEATRAARRRWDALRKQVLQGCPDCHYCGDEASTVDHLVPYSRGGKDELDNLVPACSRCNWEKLDFTVAEWKAWREERGQSWPPESRHDYLMRLIQKAMSEREDELAEAPAERAA